MKLTLKGARVTKGLTQVEVACILNVSTVTYNRYEKDVTQMNVGKLLQLCDLFGISISDLELKGE